MGADRVVSAGLTLAALTFAAVVARREFFPRQADRSLSKGSVTIELVPDWEMVLSNGIRLGSKEAPLQLVEFVDFECPVCRAFAQGTLADIKRRFGDQLAISYVHFPLSIHRFAKVSAQAAECAAKVGRFGDMVDVLFAKQDSFGLRSWSAYARDAGIQDTVAFGTCIMATIRHPRIDSGVAWAERMRITGTPTLILNGWRFSSPPSERQLTLVADSLRAGRKPGL